ncbi:hypothetical protein RHECNPAF_12600101 [Rhizobium etli CNPAF512]|nr:hypothetical protein RHECNPAF_12600101 [Rhizobium etli CNPAF512]
MVRPPLRRELHGSEAGLDRGDQHPDHRQCGVKQHEHKEDASAPPPAVNAQAPTRVASMSNFCNCAHWLPSFCSLPLSART